MSTTYTVTEVSSEVEEYQDNYGPKKRYRMHLMPPDGTTPILNVQWSRKPDSPAPQPDQQLTGDITDDPKWGPKFKLAAQFPVGSGGPRGGESYKADPAKQAAIAMESSQKVAVDVLRIAVESGAYKPAEERPVGEMTTVLKTIAQQLYAQVAEVSK